MSRTDAILWQLPQHRSPLTTVRAAALSMPPCPLWVGRTHTRIGAALCGSAAADPPGWAGGVSALRCTTLRVVWHRYELRISRGENGEGHRLRYQSGHTHELWPLAYLRIV